MGGTVRRPADAAPSNGTADPTGCPNILLAMVGGARLRFVLRRADVGPDCVQIETVSALSPNVWASTRRELVVLCSGSTVMAALFGRSRRNRLADQTEATGARLTHAYWTMTRYIFLNLITEVLKRVFFLRHT